MNVSLTYAKALIVILYSQILYFEELADNLGRLYV